MIQKLRAISQIKLPVYIVSILNSYSEIFFIHGRLSGCLILLVSFINYHTALAGLFAVVVGYCFAHFIGLNKAYLKSGFYTYNPLLVGFSIGSIFQLSWLTLSVIAISSILAFILTLFLANILYYHFRLPPLSIPFVLVSSLVYLAGGRFANLYVSEFYVRAVYQDFTFLPHFVNGFFKTIGSIIFMPNALSGLLISLLILIHSRILFMLAVGGFALGTSLNALFSGSWLLSINDLSNFNYVLIAVAIGGIFNIPSPKSFSIAAIAVAISTLLINAVNVFWSLYGIPVFTLPFTLVTLSLIYILGVVGYDKRPIIMKSTPEATLDHFLTSQHRFPTMAATLSLPYYGLWSVWQGFDGKWTHKGPWRYAYDFVVTDINGKTFANQGHYLADYYAFKLQVISPVRGRVIRVVSHLPDNTIGSVDTVNNWGNFIIIHDERGFFVELSHFSKETIQVYEGQWVEPGTHLGLCGNSGYSPQPHIHIQVQASAHIGAETIPFTFVHYTEGNHYRAHGLPALDQLAAGGVPSPFLDQVTTFILDEVLSYQVHQNDDHVENIEFKVQMALDGTFYFARGDAKLYFGKHAGTFYLYHLEGRDPYLRLVYIALASIPLHSQVQLTWDDTISNISILNRVQGALASLYHAFIPNKLKTTAHYQFISETRIIGEIRNDFFRTSYTTAVDLDPYEKLQRIQVNSFVLQRHAPENSVPPQGDS